MTESRAAALLKSLRSQEAGSLPGWDDVSLSSATTGSMGLGGMGMGMGGRAGGLSTKGGVNKRTGPRLKPLPPTSKPDFSDFAKTVASSSSSSSSALNSKGSNFDQNNAFASKTGTIANGFVSLPADDQLGLGIGLGLGEQGLLLNVTRPASMPLGQIPPRDTQDIEWRSSSSSSSSSSRMFRQQSQAQSLPQKDPITVLVGSVPEKELRDLYYETKSEKAEYSTDHRIIITERQGDLAKRLSNKLATARQEHKQSTEAASNAVNASAAMLPTQFLIKHSQFDFVKTRGPGKMMKLLQKMRIKLLIQAMGFWKAAASDLTAVLKIKSGFLMTRIGRGLIARARCKRILKERADAAVLAIKLAKIQTLSPDECATLLQNAMQLLYTRRQFYKLLRRNRSSVKITTALKSYLRVKKAVAIVSRKRQELKATRLMQRFMRGFKWRLMVWNMRTFKFRSVFQIRYKDKDSIMNYYFEQMGAAQRIQRFMKMLRWKTKVRRNRKRVNASIRIQRCYRTHCGLKFGRMVRRVKKKADDDLYRSVCLFQALGRMFLVRSRMGHRLRLRFRIGTNRPDPILPDARRRKPGFFYPHMIIKDMKYINNTLTPAASLIQLQWRVFLARRWRKNAWVIWKNVCAQKMQHWSRCWKYREIRNLATKIHSKLYEDKRELYNRKWKSAAYLQKIWRNILLARSKAHPNKIKRLQFWWRAKVYKKRRKEVYRQRRSGVEQIASGAQLLTRTMICVYYETMWGGIMAKGFASEVKHEMQRVFTYSSPQGLIEPGKVLKLINACPGFYQKDIGLDAQATDLLISKVRGPSEKKLTFEKFIQLLFILGGLKFNLKHKDIPAEKKKAPAKKKPKASAPKSDSETEKDMEKEKEKEPPKPSRPPPTDAKDFKFGRLKGKAAIVCRFIDLYFNKVGDFKKAVTELRTYSCDSRSAKKVDDSVAKIQRWIKMRVRINRRNHFINAVMWCVQRSKHNKVANLIQGGAKIFLGRLGLIKMAQNMYVKYTDMDQNPPREYWFNPRTGNAFWNKPRLLGKKDCGAATRMPNKEEAYEVYCNVCVDSIATIRCEDCALPFCNKCFREAHRGGDRVKHSPIEYSRCVQCDFQMSTRQCDQCEDLFCDTCYVHMHRKGRFRIHTFKWMVDKCEVCEGRAAQWCRKVESDNFIPENMCVPCIVSKYDENPLTIVENPEVDLPFSETHPWVSRIEYIGLSVQEYRDKMAFIMKCIAIEELDALRKMIKRNRLEFVSATTIQKRVRGILLRGQKWLEEFQIQRRHFFVLRDLENPFRLSWQYRVKSIFGFPMKFMSDTNVELLDRIYSSSMIPVVEQCMDGDLKKAYILIREQTQWQWEKKKRLEEEEIAAEAAAVEAAMVEKEAKEKDIYAKLDSDSDEESTTTTDEAPTPPKNDKKKDVSLSPKTKEKKTRGGRAYSEIKTEEPDPEVVKVVDNFSSTGGFQPGKDISRYFYTLEEMKIWWTAVKARRAQKQAELNVDREERVLADIEAQLLLLDKLEMDSLADDPAAQQALIKKKTSNKGATPSQVKAQLEVLELTRDKLVETANALNEAESAWINIIGPEALQRLVKKRIKNGFPLQFRLDFRKHSRYARVNWLANFAGAMGFMDEYDEEGNLTQEAQKRADMMCPGGWKMVLKPGMTIMVRGAHFKVMDNDEEVLPDYESSVFSGSIENLDDASNASDGDGSPSKENAEPDKDDTVDLGEDDFVDDDSTEAGADDSTVSGDDSLIASGGNVTDDHIKLDRVWVVEHEDGLEAFTPVILPPKQALVKKLGRFFHKSYPTQKVIQISAIVYHKLGRLSETIAGLFDADSPNADKFRVRAAHFRVTRDRIAKYSIGKFEWSFDFSLRRKFGRFFSRQIRGIKQSYKEHKKRMQDAADAAALTPYQEACLNPVQSLIAIDIDEDGADLIRLGEFNFAIGSGDSATAVSTLREFVHRRLQNELLISKRKIGNNFRFISADAKHIPLNQNEEKANYALDYIAEKIDPDTMESTQCVSIVWDKNDKFSHIPEYDKGDDLMVKYLLEEREKANRDPLEALAANDDDDMIEDSVILQELLQKEKDEREVKKNKILAKQKAKENAIKNAKMKEKQDKVNTGKMVQGSL